MTERVKAIAPEILSSEKIPNFRVASPEEVAEPVVWLCSDAASYITGDAMAIDNGLLAR